ncbi:acyl-CoA dehydratase activase [Sinanaerobacter chloroacetimidivorans]|jgi:predicted CoA-substrate-specific enzyme activase|uniref:2-hydroxyglutaryl-CoA dehydratase n=1 Tax=Sinanaerobacter chloroacetimidivorans TaxID=2818044 RepID=A0A8J8B3K5_9FIRM|nr:acyl-CoA dehydratase activase [Sinanaerobacter chloroacetimidivorans]MBR0600429.1 2-hydroxyglutaryl-CoA dehydratase [Sinanaerobacter chloroacetimidivorans]
MYYLGIDVGSVSTDFVVMDKDKKIIEQHYLKTKGNPIGAVKEGLRLLGKNFKNSDIKGVGTTGSGRSLASVVTGADLTKNEITTHGVAAATLDPEIRTIVEIGGQDSKIILLNHGVITDFAMNTVCAAGTGSFLDRQAERLGLKVDELGAYALRADNPVRIAGRCAVFAESDIIHKQQLGCTMEDIIAGMSKALVRNYLSNVAKGKEMNQKVCFQGGVAANEGIRAALSEALKCDIFVPEYHKVMGAYGSAVMVQELVEEENKITRFKGFEVGDEEITSESFECSDCSNHCEVVILRSQNRQIGCFSDRCGKYQNDSAPA